MSLLNISPYISWKGTSTNSIVPSYSKPDLTVSGPHFKANPIRHWRKQLMPTSSSDGSSNGSGNGNSNGSSSNRRAGIGMPMDTPGGSTYLGNVINNTLKVSCNGSCSAAGLKENIEKYDNISCKSNKNDCYYEGPRRIKSSTTLLSKRYYADRKDYLRSRCLSFDQKLTALPKADVTYLSEDGNLLYPNSTDTVRRTQNCPVRCSSAINSSSCNTIYKPNNIQYAKQGAVDSSDRLTRLKLNTINKNAASYAAVFGSSASRYLGMASTPYFLKSKYQVCVPMGLSGQKSICIVNSA